MSEHMFQQLNNMDPWGGGGPPSYIHVPPAGGTIAYLYARLVPGEGLSPAVRYCPRCRFAFGAGCGPSRFVLVLVVPRSR